MRKFLFVIAMQIAHYLIWAFCYFDFNFFAEITRLMYIFTAGLTGVFTSGLIDGCGSGTPEWLKPKPHAEKISSVKKYIGELHEELSLLGEAIALQKKISEFKSKK